MGSIQYSSALFSPLLQLSPYNRTDSLSQSTVRFINDEASSVHGNLKVASIYTSESGEWKLGGFEVLSNVKDDDAVIYVCSQSDTNSLV